MNLRILTPRIRRTGRHPHPILEWAMVCRTCEVTIPGYADENEAAYLAGVHNDLHHGSRPDAIVAPVTEPCSGPNGWRGDAA